MRPTKSFLKTAAAFIVFAGGLGAVWHAYQSQRVSPPAASPGRASAEFVERLDAANFHDVTEEELARITASLRRSITQSLSTAPSRDRMPQRLAAAFSEAVPERVQMYLQPDYEAYVARLSELTGTPPEDLRGSDRVLEEEVWRGFARKYAGAQIDPEEALVYPIFIDGVNVAPARGGHRTFMKGEDLYAPGLDPKQDRLTIYEALIPIRAPVAMELRGSRPVGGEIETPVYLSLEFVWRDELNKWLPWRAGVYNPSAKEVVLFAPWI